MSNLTEFFTAFFGFINPMIDYMFICGAIIIIGAVILIELIKTFNPDINTPREAVEYLTQKIEEQENTDEPEPFIFSEIFKLKNKFDLLLMPLFGSMVVLAVTGIFTSYRPMMLEIIENYYIPVLTYIAVFVALYTVGAHSVSSFLWFIDKAIEIFGSIVKIIKEKKLDE